MMCFFCGNRTRCWEAMTDEELEQEWVKCGYDDYVLDDAIEVEDLIGESMRREEEKKIEEENHKAG